MSLFLILMLPLAVTQVSTITVRAGDDVTLPCDNMKDLNDECNRTTWLFSGSGTSSPLFEHGKIHKDVGSKSDRLSVTTNCLLVIKKVTDEDDGRYTCRQFNISGHQVTDSGVDLSVSNKEDTTTTMIKATMTTKILATSSKTPSTVTVTAIVVAVILAAFIITVVAVVRWKKTKGNRTQTNENTELNVNPEGTGPGPETSRPDKADPADNVYYTSISFNKDTKSKARGKPDEGDAVTYSTVKAPSTSAGASTNPNGLYSSIP
ncbi:uncharacterized protein LOC124998625 isoform X4 [Mugil cephalus]|uniref:uncharacterized protein LOC124998625 isoform X4 n=1 Tax=Mugil cephalus TaxID=48193 RepID=UPI001FB61615|nr:uncharacterized protein LOC124998625 isoform X4 [Mugil cephalus]